ncbi:protein nemuri [Drosophila eugracilis]|uniref:protein nemuri n=1 Tax=Drosophila eugracilis TaxID=29029 RepID=UPI0007E893B0|nr:protein nemuri [Drosophila eugracilis]
MSAKIALIFALAAFCCLVVSTESAAQRSRVISSRRGTELVEKNTEDQSKEAAELEAQLKEIERQENSERNPLEGRSDEGAVAVEKQEEKDTTTNDKDTIVKPNKDDARARRIIRAGRRRGGRRGARRSSRRSARRGRRGGRRGGRRRGGRRGRAGARRRTSIKRRSGKGNKA